MEEKKNIKNQIFEFIKKEIVLIVALALGVLGLIIAKPAAKETLSFIDFRVLGILLSLMLVMEGYKSTGAFSALATSLIKRCKTTFGCEMVLVFLCFFTSMLITNDVALITFVPFSFEVLKLSRKEERLVNIVVEQTLAANLGSMLTPLGNPQNLYLYNLMGVSLPEFIRAILPYSLMAGVLLLILIASHKKEKLEELSLAKNEIEDKNVTLKNVILSVLFVVCLLCVLKVIEAWLMTAIVVAVILIMNFRLLIKADYSLLFTFIGFFVFIGSVEQIERVRELLSYLVNGKEFLYGVLLSQIISNVPAAILLSGFTSNLRELLIGVNVGGLGTLIASMASLISYKQILKNRPSEGGRYFKVFTLENIGFLICEVLLFVVLKVIC